MVELYVFGLGILKTFVMMQSNQLFITLLILNVIRYIKWNNALFYTIKKGSKKELNIFKVTPSIKTFSKKKESSKCTICPIPTNSNLFQILSKSTKYSSLSITYSNTPSSQLNKDFQSKTNIRRYFCQEFMYYIPKYIIQTKNFKYNQMLLLTQKIMKEITFFIFSHLQLCQKYTKLVECLKIIFQIQRHYYKQNSQTDNIYNYPFNLQDFFEKLQIGQTIDAIKYDQYQKKRAMWAHAQILNIQMLYIRGQNLRQIAIKCCQFAPYGSKVQKNWEWRLNVNEGDQVDYQFERYWHISTISKVYRNTNQYGEVVIQINLKNSNQIEFQDLSIMNPRIQKANYISGQQQLERKIFFNQLFIDDYNDIILKYPDHIIAIPRPMVCKSIFIVDLINYLFQIKVFDKILDLIDNEKNFDVAPAIIFIIGIIHPLFKRQFALEYLPQIQNKIVNSLFKKQGSNIRNLSKQKIDNIINALNQILKRYSNNKFRRFRIGSISLELAFLCFNSQFLQRKLQGLSSIIQILKNCKQNSIAIKRTIDYQQQDQTESQLNMENMLNLQEVESANPHFINQLGNFTIVFIKEWIKKKKIFDFLFKVGNHPQLLQRSGDFIAFLINQKMLTNKKVEQLWQFSQKIDQQCKLTMYKTIQDVGKRFSEQQIQIILKEVFQKNSTQIDMDQIELIYQITRHISNINITKKIVQFYWNLLSEMKDNFKKDKYNISELLCEKILQIMKSWEMKEYRQDYIIYFLKDHKNPMMLGYMMRIIPDLISYTSTFKLKSMIMIYINEKNIIDNVIDSMNLNQENKQILDFLIFIFDNIENENSMFQMVESIWTKIKHLTIAEIKFYDAFKRVLFRLKKDQLLNFFNNNLCQQSNLLKMNKPFFNVFKFLFIKINYDLNKFQKIYEDNYISKKYPQRTFMTGKSYSYSYQQRKQQNEEYIVMVDPNQLVGIEFLMHIIFENLDFQVIEKALQFTNYLYNNLNNSLEVKKKTMQGQFVEKCLKWFYKSTQDYQKESNKQNKTKILKYLEIFKSILNQSEKYGNGKLTSLQAMTNNNFFQININNQMSNDYTLKRFKIKVNSNDLLFDVRYQIGIKINSLIDQFKIFNNGQQLKFNLNGLSIQKLKINQSNILNIHKNQNCKIQRSPLLINGYLNPLAINSLKYCFNLYSTNNRMSKQQCLKFLQRCIGQISYMTGDARVDRLFEQYDKDKDGFLEWEEFLLFYQTNSKQREATVWQNLQSFGIRNDLKFAHQIPKKQVGYQSLPRYNLILNQRFIGCMKNLLQKQDQIRCKCWQLLDRLPIPFVFYKEIVEDQNCNFLNQTHSFQYIIGLYIIYNELSNQKNQKQNLYNILLKEIYPLIQNCIQKFMKGFYLYGVQIIFKRLLDSQQFQNRSIILIIKIIRLLLEIGLGKFIPFINESLSFIHTQSQYFDLDIDISSCEYQEEHVILKKINQSKQIFKMKFEHQDLLITKDLIEIKFMVIIYFSKKLNQNIEEDLEMFQKRIRMGKREICYAKILYLIYLYNINEQNSVCNTIFNLVKEAFLLQNQLLSNDYYALFSGILNLVRKNKPLIFNNDDILNNLVEKTLNRLITHQSTEYRYACQADPVIFGSLQILNSLISFNTVKIIKKNVQYIFSKFLFKFKEGTIKFKSLKTRQKCYQLIARLCQYQSKYGIVDNQCKLSIFQILFKCGLKQIFASFYAIKSNYCYNQSRSELGYAGLRNLGCICYMLAMIQQFFMIKVFKSLILIADDKNQPNLVKKRIRYFDDNVFHQFQMMFAHLELTQRQDYNPEDFCLSFKDNDGNPVNTLIQQDAQQFLNMLFDKLQFSLKQTPFMNIINGIFGGKICNQFKCKNCNNVTNKEECFFNISLEVKNMKNIKESLEKFIYPQIISDYNCQNCNSKSDVTKKCFISSMPNVLIVYLQRICYNYDMSQNQKINTRWQFPKQINFGQYTLEGNSYQHYDKLQYQYKLKGIVVHIGSAQSGHYYSYIEIKQGKWLQFNDERVKEFDPKNIYQECFGGHQQDYGYGWYKRESYKSAYLLVYQKLIKTDIELVFQEKTDIEKVINIGKLEKAINKQQQREQKTYIYLDYNKIEVNIPYNIKQSIIKDNQQFGLQMYLTSKQFMEFIFNLTKVDPPIQIKNKILQFLYECLMSLKRQSRIKISDTFFRQVNNLYQQNNYQDNQQQFKIIKSILQTRQLCLEKWMFVRFKKLIKGHSFQFFKSNYSNWTIVILQGQRGIRNTVIKICLYTIMDIINNQQNSIQVFKKQQLQNFMEQMINLLQFQVSKYWYNFNQYFEFWENIINNTDYFNEWIYKNHLLENFLDFFLQQSSPIKKSRMIMKQKMKNPSFEYVLSAIKAILYKSDFFQKQGFYKINRNQMKCLYRYHFLDKCIKYDIDFSINLIRMLQNKNKSYAEKVAYIILFQIDKVRHSDQMKTIFRIVRQYFNISPQLLDKKTQLIFGIPFYMIQENKQQSFGLYGINNFEQKIICYQCPFRYSYFKSVLQYLIINKNKYQHICIVMLFSILYLMNKYEYIRRYIVEMPGYNICTSKYIDWWQSYIQNYYNQIEMPYVNSSYEIYASKTLEQLKIFKNIYSQMLQSNYVKQLINIKNNQLKAYVQLDLSSYIQQQILSQTYIKPYLFGQIKSKKIVMKFQVQDILEIVQTELQIYICESLPTGQTNLTIPGNLIYKNTSHLNISQKYLIDVKNADKFYKIKNLKNGDQNESMREQFNKYFVVAPIRILQLYNKKSTGVHVTFSYKSIDQQQPQILPRSPISIFLNSEQIMQGYRLSKKLYFTQWPKYQIIVQTRIIKNEQFKINSMSKFPGKVLTIMKEDDSLYQSQDETDSFDAQ